MRALDVTQPEQLHEVSDAAPVEIGNAGGGFRVETHLDQFSYAFFVHRTVEIHHQVAAPFDLFGRGPPAGEGHHRVQHEGAGPGNLLEKGSALLRGVLRAG